MTPLRLSLSDSTPITVTERNMPIEMFEQRWPTIPWREPINVCGWTHDGVAISRFACRICLALNGLKGQDVERLPTRLEEIQRHIKTHL